MTATRIPILSCDWHDCDQQLWVLAEGTARGLRIHAQSHDWARFDHRDWCPTHANQLGITHRRTP